MAQQLLSIFRIYWSVLCAIARCILEIVLWVTVSLIFDAITGWSTDTRDGSSVGGAGIGWLLYVVAAVALALVLHSHGAPGWLVDLAVAVSVLGVLPIHWAFGLEQSRRTDGRPV